jgi:mannosyltransferase
MRALVVAVLVSAVALRFLTKSPLWLDEALTVNIAKRPLREIPHLLRDDGAPPLYYFLLHFWMKVFGTGDVASRSLAGVCGVINLPVAWLTGHRVGARSWRLADASSEERAVAEARGRTTAWSVTLLLASSPFAMYYDTEARMYGFVLLLGTLAVLATASLLRSPSWTRALAIAVITSALLYTHYWSLYVAFVAGLVALWCSWRGPHRLAARYGLAGLVVGGLSFVPWLPTFLFQLKHTGTPWAATADYTAIVFTFTQFAGGNSSAGRALALIFFFLVILAIFGIAQDSHHVLLDLRTRPGVRAITAGVLATLFVAIVAGRASGSTFADRYTSVIAFPALLIFAYGLTAISSPHVRQGIVAAAVALGFAASIPNASLLRTQAGEVAAALTADARPGDLVVYCPDQLGPSVSRLLDRNYRQITFPRGTGPAIVDWVDYVATIDRTSTFRFAERVERLAGDRTIWYVTAPQYQGFGNDCQDIGIDLARYRVERTIVANQPADTPFEIYEGMGLERFGLR